MILTTHQPIFLPWSGFFCKALHADVMVLLDDVQFPFGSSWMTRNRLKSDKGELWVTVPVWKKGRGKQIIREVEICNDRDWANKHLRSICEQYSNAPYIKDLFPVVEGIYKAGHHRLIELNLELIRFFWKEMSIQAKLLFQSDLIVTGSGTDLLIKVCQAAGADSYTTLLPVQKYLDEEQFRIAGIQTQFIRFTPPVYPQLWGDFLPNLSAFDLLLNCGPRARDILMSSCRQAI